MYCTPIGSLDQINRERVQDFNPFVNDGIIGAKEKMFLSRLQRTGLFHSITSVGCVITFRRSHIEVIAEGIEYEKDLRICREIGIDLVQGYLIARPSADLATTAQLNIPENTSSRQSGTTLFDEVICVGDIAAYVAPLSATDRILEALNRFNDNAEMVCLPVLRGGQLCGLLNRHRFMETQWSAASAMVSL